MTRETNVRWFLIVAANVAMWFMLGLHRTDGAPPASPLGVGPTATEQRAEIIAQLKEIRAELKQVIKLRQTGALPITDSAP